MIYTVAKDMPRELLLLASQLEATLASIRRELNRPSSQLRFFAREVAALTGSAGACIQDLDRLGIGLYRTYSRESESNAG